MALHKTFFRPNQRIRLLFTKRNGALSRLRSTLTKTNDAQHPFGFRQGLALTVVGVHSYFRKKIRDLDEKVFVRADCALANSFSYVRSPYLLLAQVVMKSNCGNTYVERSGTYVFAARFHRLAPI